jgi:HAD superfamily hydrolase (TIGR01549 family)
MKQTLTPDAVDAVLFDLDGTLIDTDDQAVETISQWLRRLHAPRPERLARRLLMAAETPGNLAMTALDILGIDAAMIAAAAWFQRLRGVRGPGDLRVVAGGKEMLTLLQPRYKLGIVTTRGAQEAETFQDQHGLAEVFDVVVTRDSTLRLKPHPAPIRRAAVLLDLPPARCVMVGDTSVDIRSARRAGAWAVGVLCGFGERRELERAGADHILEHTALLTTIL